MSTATNPIEEQRELEEESVGTPLFNPSPEFVTAIFSAHDFLFPPNGTAIHPDTKKRVTADGVLVVKDLYGQEWAKDSDEGRMMPTGVRTLVLSRVDVVKFILKNYATRGIVKLSGDPRKDEPTKKAAMKAWNAFQLTWAKTVIAKRDIYLREFNSSPGNAGHVPDAPNEMETNAYDVIAKHRIGTTGRLEHVCKHDGYQTDDRDDFQTHMLAFHPKEAEESAKAAAKAKSKGSGS